MSESTTHNFAATICRKHKDAIYRVALEEKRCAGINTYTFGGLDYLSDKFASILHQGGVKPGDAVAIVLSQSAAFPVAHLGVLKLGAIVAAIPSQLESRLIHQALQECQPKVLVIDETEIPRLDSLLGGLQDTIIFIASDYVSKIDFANGYRNFWHQINNAGADFQTVETEAASLAYCFFDADDRHQLSKIPITHGDLLAASQSSDSLEKSFPDEELPFQTSTDWARMKVLTGELFPAWYRGRPVSTIN